MWVFNIQTNHDIQHWCPDIQLMHKGKRKRYLIVIVVLGDQRIEKNEKEKIKNYADQKKEVKMIWNISFVAVMVVEIEALRSISKDFQFWLEKLDLRISTELTQLITLLKHHIQRQQRK